MLGPPPPCRGWGGVLARRGGWPGRRGVKASLEMLGGPMPGRGGSGMGVVERQGGWGGLQAVGVGTGPRGWAGGRGAAARGSGAGGAAAALTGAGWWGGGGGSGRRGACWWGRFSGARRSGPAGREAVGEGAARVRGMEGPVAWGGRKGCGGGQPRAEQRIGGGRDECETARRGDHRIGSGPAAIPWMRWRRAPRRDAGTRPARSSWRLLAPDRATGG